MGPAGARPAARPAGPDDRDRAARRMSRRLAPRILKGEVRGRVVRSTSERIEGKTDGITSRPRRYSGQPVGVREMTQRFRPISATSPQRGAARSSSTCWWTAGARQQVAAAYGIAERQVGRWVAAYRRRGMASLRGDAGGGGVAAALDAAAAHADRADVGGAPRRVRGAAGPDHRAAPRQRRWQRAPRRSRPARALELKAQLQS